MNIIIAAAVYSLLITVLNIILVNRVLKSRVSFVRDMKPEFTAPDPVRKTILQIAKDAEIEKTSASIGPVPWIPTTEQHEFMLETAGQFTSMELAKKFNVPVRQVLNHVYEYNIPVKRGESSFHPL